MGDGNPPVMETLHWHGLTLLRSPGPTQGVHHLHFGFVYSQREQSR